MAAPYYDGDGNLIQVEGEGGEDEYHEADQGDPGAGAGCGHGAPAGCRNGGPPIGHGARHRQGHPEDECGGEEPGHGTVGDDIGCYGGHGYGGRPQHGLDSTPLSP